MILKVYMNTQVPSALELKSIDHNTLEIKNIVPALIRQN